jgi:hypothetical protein
MAPTKCPRCKSPDPDTINPASVSAVAENPDVPRHPGEIRADGTKTTAARKTADARRARPETTTSLGTAVEKMKAEPGPPMTLGGAAAAGVRLIVWCKGCAEHASRCGAEVPVLEWALWKITGSVVSASGKSISHPYP